MRIFATVLSVALLSIPGASLFSQDMMMAGTGFYVAAGGGAMLMTNTTDTEQDIPGSRDEADWYLDFGFSAGGAAGYDFGDFRTEAEFSFQSANFRHGEEIDNDNDKKADDSLTVMAILANGFFDLDTGTPFVPYVGIGFGGVNVAVKLAEDDADPDFDGAGWGLGYQANVGVAYEIIDAVALTLGYKFSGTFATEVKDKDDEDAYVKPMLMAHRGELGVRFKF